MLNLNFNTNGGALSILCLGAHADDIEIGCGGTILKLIASHPGCSVRWVVFSADGGRKSEAEAAATRFVAGCIDATVEVLSFRDGYFPSEYPAIKDVFERLKADCTPSLIFTHFRDDSHQDHRLLADLTWNTFRDHLIWEYEIPKYEGDLGNPNIFVPLSEAFAERKVTALLDSFPSQWARPWFNKETFLSMLRLRAVGCRAPAGLAEAFYSRKAVL